MKNHKLIISLLMIVIGALLGGCAMRQPPSGGPADKTPPAVVATVPRSDSTRVGRLPYIEIQFDEAIDRASVRNQFWLLPELPTPPAVSWKGSRRLRLVLNDSLYADQTYILTLGTGIKDVHNNKLGAPFVLPFSTGDQIDHGEISGRVVGEKVSGVFVYGYPLADSLEPGNLLSARPRYYTQVGQGGQFALKFLRAGRYRVFALDDQNGDRLYSFQVDRVALPSTDVRLDSVNMKRSDLNFTLIREDTLGPHLARAAGVSANRLELQFNEDLLTRQTLQIQIHDSLQQRELPVLAYEVDEKSRNKLIVFTATQQAVRYLGSIQNAVDAAGNPDFHAGAGRSADSAMTFSFSGVEKPDTTTTRLSRWYPPDGQSNVRYNSDIWLQLSQPVDTLTARAAVRLLAGADTLVEGRWDFSVARRPRFLPATPLARGKTFTLSIDLAGLKSVYGQSFGDSLLTSRFTTWKWSELGEISGTVHTGNPAWKKALLEALPERGTELYSAAAETNKPYEISFLPGGKYRLRAVIDANGNGRADAGSTSPFQFAEPFLIYPDTVTVRKRWTTEGIDFQFGE